MKCKISVIVPVYNVKPYLPKCIGSLLGQTFLDYEIILVDDGSLDGSGDLCECMRSRITYGSSIRKTEDCRQPAIRGLHMRIENT